MGATERFKVESGKLGCVILIDHSREDTMWRVDRMGARRRQVAPLGGCSKFKAIEKMMVV